jgi:hypothetical protein
MSGIGEEPYQGWVPKTVEVFMPKGLKAVMEVIREILLKGKIQKLTMEVGRPITYVQYVKAEDEPLAEVATMTLGDVARNVQMDEYRPSARTEDNLLAWHRMWLAIALRGLYVTHIGVGSSTRLFRWLGLDEMVYGGLQQMYGADIVRDKQLSDDIVVLFAGLQVGGPVEAITYAVKCHLLSEDDLATKEENHGPGIEGQVVGGGNHSGRRGQADGTVADAANGKSGEGGVVRSLKGRTPQG